MSIKSSKTRGKSGNYAHSSSRYGSKKDKAYGGYLKITALSIVVGVVSVILYYGYLQTRINTPLSVPKVISQSYFDNPSRYWGTYRPGVYFGTSVRHPLSPITGMMWYMEGHLQNGDLAFRHWCSEEDGLRQYGWIAHNGRDFGAQIIKDKLIDIETYFVKNGGGIYGGDWSARINATPISKSSRNLELTYFYYFALNPEDSEGLLELREEKGYLILNGYSEALGSFNLVLKIVSGDGNIVSTLATKSIGMDMIKETIFKNLRLLTLKKGKYVRFSQQKARADEKIDIIIFQVVGYPPFEFDVLFRSTKSTADNILFGERLSERISNLLSDFDTEFESKFGLRRKGFAEDKIQFAKAALSNMIGSIGYFYGASKVEGINNEEPVPYWKAPLLTGVPSRSFFPRGFLWDEGFHNLLISKWDRNLSMDIIGHWFDLMNTEGWIPREQILGKEAIARVPSEFIIQNNKAANPPTLILTLHSMMTGFSQKLTDSDLEYLNRLWPRLKVWYNWYNTTQIGSLPGTYRWRGRDAESTYELNPKTLTSGLDDYPRASHPTNDERHLDLRCWMALASKLMADLAAIIGKDGEKFEKSFKFLSDNNNLDALHWSYISNNYMDYGLHTDNIVLKRTDPEFDKIRIVKSEPVLRFVDSVGYISFFPLFLHIVDANSARLKRMLEDLRRPELLWTPYGLRSLAKNSPFYNKRNTEHDPPYWRGSIWINMNFLAIRSLKYYSMLDGPSKEIAGEVYKELRSNVINNIFNQYKKTGYLWEHYNDITGEGEGCRPFTGWTSLVVLLMSENY